MCISARAHVTQMLLEAWEALCEHLRSWTSSPPSALASWSLSTLPCDHADLIKSSSPLHPIFPQTCPPQGPLVESLFRLQPLRGHPPHNSPVQGPPLVPLASSRNPFSPDLTARSRQQGHLFILTASRFQLAAFTDDLGTDWWHFYLASLVTTGMDILHENSWLLNLVYNSEHHSPQPPCQNSHSFIKQLWYTPFVPDCAQDMKNTALFLFSRSLQSWGWG